MRLGWVDVEWEFQRAMGDLKHGFAGGQDRIAEAAGEQLFTGHAEPLQSELLHLFQSLCVAGQGGMPE